MNLKELAILTDLMARVEALEARPVLSLDALIQHIRHGGPLRRAVQELQTPGDALMAGLAAARKRRSEA